jgi:deoxyribonuclease-4
MYKQYYGTHLSKSNGILNTLEYAKSLNINHCQIFTKAPQKFSLLKDIEPIEKNLIENFIDKHNFDLFIHGQYILNLSRNDLPYAVKSVVQDLNYIKNSKGVIIHTGKATNGLTKEEAFNNMKNNILKILSQIEHDNYLIIETSVKTKTDLCNFWSIEGLSELYNSLDKHSNIKFCIDTCHIFASGYDISDIQQFEKYISKFDKLIGIENIVLFHLNDSKTKCGSNKDNHEELGKGYIFKEINTLKYIISWCNKYKIPYITETHSDVTLELQFLEKL